MTCRRFAVGALLCAATLIPLSAQRLFVLPTTAAGPSPIFVFREDPLSLSTTVTGGPEAVTVLAAPDGARYYVINKSGTNTVVVLSGSTLGETAHKDLGVQAQAGVLSPDGTRLVLAVNTALVLDAVTLEQKASIDVGISPDDVAVSIDSKRAFAISTNSQSVTAIDLVTSQRINPSIPVTGGLTPASLSVGPNGLIYAATVNRVYEIDPNTLTIRHTIPVTGTAGRFAFSPDGRYAVAGNKDAPVGTAIIAIDLSNYTVIGSTPIVNSPRFDKVAYAGKNAAGLERFVAFSSASQSVDEVAVQPNSIAITPSNLTASVGAVIGMAVSSELTTPRFLFVADSNNAVHQISFSNGARITANAVSPLGDIVYANPASTAGASSFIVFGNNQSVAVSGTFAPVVIRVLDANGRPVVNAPVTFTSTNPGLTLTNTTTTTNGLGYAFLSAPTPTANGQYPVTVAAGTATTTVTLTTTGGTNPGGGGVADTGLGGLFAVSGNGQVTLESTPLGQPLVVEVRDDAGKPVPNVPIAFALDETNALVGQLRTYFPSGGETGSVTCPTSISCTGVTDANGRATINFSPSVIQSGVTFRQATILVTAGNRSLNLYVTAVKVSNFTNFLDVRILKPADQGQILEVPAGGTLPGAIQAFVQVNASGVATPVANVGMTVSTGIDPTTGPTVTCGTSGTALSDNTGIATCDLVAGPKSSSLAVPLMVDVAGRRFTLTVRVTQATTPSKIQVIQGGDQHALPGQQLPLTLVAQVQDAAGNPLSGVPVTWTPSNINGVTLTNASTQSDTSGRVSAIAKVGTAPGTHIITLKAGDATATFTVRSDAALGSLVAANTPQTAEVGKTFAQPLVVTLRDTNGTPVANTTVNFAVTSGNATLSASTATTNAQGQASVTATAGATAGQSTITAIVGTLSATFTLTARLPGPSFDLNGLLNGANYQTQRGFGPNNTVAIAPGQILTITGTGIATGVQGIMIPRSLIGPLPTSLGGVQVTIGGTAAPIYNVGTVNGREQVTVQVPWELVAGTNTDIVVNVQGGSTTLSNVPVAEVAPGIFENQVGGQSVPLLVDTTDGRFVGTIARGRTYKAYLVGLGPVTPNTGTNRAGLRDQLVRDTIIVGLNNQGVRVIRAEAVEGVVGVYAVTFEVPNDTNIAPSGQTIGFAVGVIPAGSSGAVIAYAPGVLVE